MNRTKRENLCTTPRFGNVLRRSVNKIKIVMIFSYNDISTGSSKRDIYMYVYATAWSVRPVETQDF